MRTLKLAILLILFYATSIVFSNLKEIYERNHSCCISPIVGGVLVEARDEAGGLATPSGEIAIPRPDIPNKFSKTYRGKVSWYKAVFDGVNCDDPDCITASGEKYNENAFTCACDRGIALGSLIKFSYDGRSVIARCNDRGNFKKYGRVADLSKASFEALAPLSKGVLEVEVEIIRN